MTFFKKSVIILLTILLSASLLVPGSEKKVRDYLISIPWYPRSADQLNDMLDTFFKNADSKPVPGKIVGLIGPHAGLSYSGQCAANAYKQILSDTGLERIIMLGLSHRVRLYGAAVSDFDANGTPFGTLPVDTEITTKLAKEKLFRKSNSIIQNEHSLETHLPFLHYVLKKQKNTRCKIVPILLGHLDKKDYKTMAGIIKKYITPNTLVIASTDFTHYGLNYGYTPFRKNIKENLTKLDMGMVDHIKRMDFDGFIDYKKKTGITMCGISPVGVMLNIFSPHKKKYDVTLTDYYKSADRNNDYSFSVSYASLVISEKKKPGSVVNRGPGKPAALKGEEKMDDNKKTTGRTLVLSTEEKKTLLSIARSTLENHFQGTDTSLEDIQKKYNERLTAPMKEKSGVFVTLKIRGSLRGCIGTIIGVEPLWEAVRNNALKAAFRDPRFYPLKKKELKAVDMEISVMTPLQQIQDYKTIRLGTDGVIIRKNGRQSVFLPQVATETGWNLDQFLGRLCRKAGLSGNEYQKEGMEFFIFQALVFGEHDIK
jgi:MEMO1 family protein